MGPFVDSNHPMIKAGRVDLTPAALFRERIAKPLAVLQSEILELLVVILPSPRDLISSHVVLPQAAIERDPELGLSRVSAFNPQDSRPPFWADRAPVPSEFSSYRIQACSRSMASALERLRSTCCFTSAKKSSSSKLQKSQTNRTANQQMQ